MQSYKSEGFDKGREQQQLAKLGSFTQENFRDENLTIQWTVFMTNTLDCDRGKNIFDHELLIKIFF